MRERDQRRLFGVGEAGEPFEQKGARERHGRDDQRDEEEEGAVLRGALRLHVGRDVAAGGAADLTGAGDGDEREDEEAVAEIAQIVAAEHRQREQSPEGGVAEAFGVAAVAARRAPRRARRSGPART